MNTQTITSYVDSITDTMLDEATKMDAASVVLKRINAPAQTGYGTWRFSADFEINGKERTLSAITHDEEAVIALKQRYSEPSDIEHSVLDLICNANESVFDDADYEAKEAAAE